MKFTTSSVAGLLATAVTAQNCQNIAGTSYCNQVQELVYKGVGYQGSYNKVTSFNNDGTCSSTPYSFSGSLSPLDEELTVHFRGPISIKQFGVYYPGGNNNQKRDEVQIQKRAGHHVHNLHKREPAFVTEYVHVTKTVFGDGYEAIEQATSSVAQAPSSAAPPPPPPPPPSSSAPPPPPPQPTTTSSSVAPPPPPPSSSSSSTPPPPPSSTFVTSSSASPSSSSSAASPSGGSSAGSWTQVAYYDSSSQTANGVTFMNHQGGSGSGVWDMNFGNSISYAGSDGTSCASSPQVLQDKTLNSNEEVVIFSSNQCSGDDCGYYRPGIPAYHGFGGADKVFVFEFSMPSASGASGPNGDMPAVWFLNAQIPRTLQYGAASCSCWSTGCGEFDAFEIVSPGNQFLTNHLHSGQGGGGAQGGGGSADYFARPTSGTLKAAIVFSGDDQSVTMIQLDSSTEFPSSLSDTTVNGWIAQGSSSNNFANLL
ncbi:Tos1p [Sugiyamaella lignohabitans]|uniref:glucan endo-1,3-beta-D-glucosidase n=1 Tax=Sugiyamaella lignohabitans TaxID=796027 RepID=A0A167D4M4_9ASCO|nr:Tos1p [Sugiyamaella lignohabitans]ANB12472.1 Tos1p [Sugiyamaella lignohabitans]